MPKHSINNYDYVNNKRIRFVQPLIKKKKTNISGQTYISTCKFCLKKYISNEEIEAKKRMEGHLLHCSKSHASSISNTMRLSNTNDIPVIFDNDVPSDGQEYEQQYEQEYEQSNSGLDIIDNTQADTNPHFLSSLDENWYMCSYDNYNFVNTEVIDYDWYKFQKKLMNIYCSPSKGLKIFSKKHYDNRKNSLEHHDNSGLDCESNEGNMPLTNTSKTPHVDDIISLIYLKCSNFLSDQVSDSVLSAFKEILTRNNVSIPLPERFATCNSAINTNLCATACKQDNTNNKKKEIFTIHKYKYYLDQNIFPDLQEKFTEGYSNDIMELISEEMLNASPCEFSLKPDRRVTDKGHHIYEDFATGDFFNNIHNEIQKIFSGATALCIHLTLDETTTRSHKQNLAETPVLFSILNFFDNSYKMILLGYTPKTLPYSDAEIKNYLRAKWKCTKGLAKDILSYAKRSQYLKYIHDLVAPIMQYQQKRCYLRVGRNYSNGAHAVEIEAYIHLVLITGDSKSQDFLAGTSSRKKFTKCRCCMLHDCITPKIRNDIVFRDDKTMDEAAKEGYDSLCMSLSLRNVTNSEEKKLISEQIKSIEKKLSDLNCCRGENPLYMAFKWQHDRKINSLHEALPPDYLHTINKGPVEYCITWCMACIMAVADIDINYNSSVSTLDKRIQSFPTIQSLELWAGHRHCFATGVSQFFTKPWTKENKGTGFFSGGLEAWKLVIMLTQLLFCINSDIISFSNSWLSDKLGSGLGFKQCNPGEILTNALSATLELYLICRSEILTKEGIESMKLIAYNTRSQLCRLWFLRKILIRKIKNKTVTTSTDYQDQAIIGILNTTRVNLNADNTGSKKLVQPLSGRIASGSYSDYFSGYKEHLYSDHLPECKKKWGTFTRTIDTQSSEQYHKDCVKENFEITNKKSKELHYQLLRNIRKKIHCDNLRPRIMNNSQPLPVAEVDSPTITKVNASALVEEEWFYNSVPQNGYDYLDYDISTDSMYSTTKTRNKFTPSLKAINCELISDRGLYDLINREFENPMRDESFCKLFSMFKNKEKDLKLAKCVNARQSKEKSNIQDFKMYCMCDESLNLVVANCAEVRYEYENKNGSESTIGHGTDIAHIVAMLCFTNKEEKYNSKKFKEDIYIVIAWMEKTKTTASTKSLIPYPSYSYIYRKSKLYFQIVKVDAVYRPVFAVFYSDSGCSWHDHKLKDKGQLSKKKLHVIPYERAFQRNCDGYVEFIKNAESIINSSSDSSSSTSARLNQNNAQSNDFGMMLSNNDMDEICQRIEKLVNFEPPQAETNDTSNLNDAVDTQSNNSGMDLYSESESDLESEEHENSELEIN